MNKTTLVIASLAVVSLAGCANTAYQAADKRPDCPGAGQNKIRVLANQGNFGVEPPHLCVDPGDSIDVQIVGNHEPGDVTMRGSGWFAPKWLRGSNSKSNAGFTITAPDEGSDDPFFYMITVDGYGTIDPMITVRKSGPR